MNVHISSVDISSPKRKTEAHGVLITKNIKVCFAQAFEGYCFISFGFQTTNFFSVIGAFCSNAKSVALDINWSRLLSIKLLRLNCG